MLDVTGCVVLPLPTHLKLSGFWQGFVPFLGEYEKGLIYGLLCSFQGFVRSVVGFLSGGEARF